MVNQHTERWSRNCAISAGKSIFERNTQSGMFCQRTSCKLKQLLNHLLKLQGRQKLARFNRAEFAGLLTDVLIDALRRQNMANLRPMDTPLPTQSLQLLPYGNNSTMYSSSFEQSMHDPNLSDDEPIYDPVASDDDYAPVPPMAQQVNLMRQKILKLNNSFG